MNQSNKYTKTYNNAIEPSFIINNDSFNIGSLLPFLYFSIDTLIFVKAYILCTYICGQKISIPLHSSVQQISSSLILIYKVVEGIRLNATHIMLQCKYDNYFAFPLETVLFNLNKMVSKKLCILQPNKILILILMIELDSLLSLKALEIY